MITFRRATRADLPAIVALLADDTLGRIRERLSDPLDERYERAYAAIDDDPNQILAVAVEGNRVVGCLQITFIPGLSHSGMWRGQIEGVRIAAAHRGSGLGRRFFEWTFEQCRQRGCGLVQLTSDKQRPDAIRFYESLGFRASHEGLKRPL
jgi:ribosomal protein S18 acetylase RimI-like enzyme